MAAIGETPKHFARALHHDGAMHFKCAANGSAHLGAANTELRSHFA
jgi:hypothetical protein